jgi:hypothetical protein
LHQISDESIVILMSNAITGKANRAAAVKAVFEGTESAIKAYGWDTNDAKEQAIRETAAEFGVTFEAVCAILP